MTCSTLNKLGDVVTTVLFSPARIRAYHPGRRPVLSVLTNNGLGSEKLGLPSVVALMQPGKWTVGSLANSISSVSGANDR